MGTGALRTGVDRAGPQSKIVMPVGISGVGPKRQQQTRQGQSSPLEGSTPEIRRRGDFADGDHYPSRQAERRYIHEPLRHDGADGKKQI